MPYVDMTVRHIKGSAYSHRKQYNEEEQKERELEWMASVRLRHCKQRFKEGLRKRCDYCGVARYYPDSYTDRDGHTLRWCGYCASGRDDPERVAAYDGLETVNQVDQRLRAETVA